jgi:hypothetical protein
LLKIRIISYDRQILSRALATAAEWHGYAALRNAAEVPAMPQETSNIESQFRSSSRPSKLAALTTGGVVFIACAGYIGWSFSESDTVATEPMGERITLSTGDEREIELNTPMLSPPRYGNETPLELDNSGETDGLPVINAHLEVPTSVEPLQLGDLPDSQLRQLSHGSASPAEPQRDAAGAWLTGTIESPSPTDAVDSDPAISRFVR